ncbi:MAG TPA: hypothetical protein V6C93_16460 [Allocoleopsis sp.]
MTYDAEGGLLHDYPLPEFRVGFEVWVEKPAWIKVGSNSIWRTAILRLSAKSEQHLIPNPG